MSDSVDTLADIPLDRRPKHIAVIMDGNGRWANERGLPRIEGHRRGVETVREVMEACKDANIECLTLYCFSSENWKRPVDELTFLMELLRQYLIAERETIVKNNLKLRIIGRRDGLPEDVLVEMDKTVAACQHNTGMTLCLAINYGSRQEIADAVRTLAQQVAAGKLSADSIDIDAIGNALDTAGLPDPDLVVRTSGELRISNFLLWQISYSEIWVTETAWPDFTRNDLYGAIRDYVRRQRRFGGLGSTA